MKTIPLTQGKVALVDDEDYEWLSQWKWCAAKSRSSGLYYAVRTVPHPDGGVVQHGKQRARRRVIHERMHMLIAGTPRSGNRQSRVAATDHKNGDGLDNRRENLRVCTDAGNGRNKRKGARPTSSRFKGVNRQCRRWCARVAVAGERRRFLGYFDTELAAAIAYNIAAVQLHGEFARLNDVFSGEVA